MAIYYKCTHSGKIHKHKSCCDREKYDRCSTRINYASDSMVPKSSRCGSCFK